jgi:hypothetical protein
MSGWILCKLTRMGKYSIDEEYAADAIIRYEAWVIAGVLLLTVAAAVYRCAYGPALWDDRMLDAAGTVQQSILVYYGVHGQWPESLEQVKADQDLGIDWPENPYHHQPITDSGSPDFAGAASVGMVHYEPVLRDGQQVGFKLHVFGKTQKLEVISYP